MSSQKTFVSKQLTISFLFLTYIPLMDRKLERFYQDMNHYPFKTSSEAGTRVEVSPQFNSKLCKISECGKF